MLSTQDNTLYWLAALHLYGVGPVTFNRWLQAFPNIRDLFTVSAKELKYAGFSLPHIQLLKKIDWQQVESTKIWCQKNQCHILTREDKDYPSLLAQIDSAPLVLFVQGDKQLLSHPQIAMVGSRNPTTIGYEIAEKFSCQLAAAGFVITSGLALGIDAASHQGALSVGKTVAVLGTGLNYRYPKTNEKLADKILQSGGSLVSEFLPHIFAKASHFPIRNRIISGLSMGVLIVEAALKSGSLITARYAIEQGREVFAVPGSIHNVLSRGCHHLLRQGAKLVETCADVIDEINVFIDMYKQKAASDLLECNLQPYENKNNFINFIGYEVTPFEAILIRSGLTSGEVSSILLSLELEGYIKAVLGGYIRTAKTTKSENYV